MAPRARPRCWGDASCPVPRTRWSGRPGGRGRGRAQRRSAGHTCPVDRALAGGRRRSSPRRRLARSTYAAGGPAPASLLIASCSAGTSAWLSKTTRMRPAGVPPASARRPAFRRGPRSAVGRSGEGRGAALAPARRPCRSRRIRRRCLGDDGHRSTSKPCALSGRRLGDVDVEQPQADPAAKVLVRRRVRLVADRLRATAGGQDPELGQLGERGVDGAAAELRHDGCSPRVHLVGRQVLRGCVRNAPRIARRCGVTRSPRARRSSPGSCQRPSLHVCRREG